MLAAILLCGASIASAEEPALHEKMMNKLFRGVVNFSTGWTEIPVQTYHIWTNEGWVAGAFRGPFDGLGMFVARTVAGMVEIATFPFPLPTYGPLMQPAYVWDQEPRDDVRGTGQ